MFHFHRIAIYLQTTENVSLTELQDVTKQLKMFHWQSCRMPLKLVLFDWQNCSMPPNNWQYFIGRIAGWRQAAKNVSLAELHYALKLQKLFHCQNSSLSNKLVSFWQNCSQPKKLKLFYRQNCKMPLYNFKNCIGRIAKCLLTNENVSSAELLDATKQQKNGSLAELGYASKHENVSMAELQ